MATDGLGPVTMTDRDVSRETLRKHEAYIQLLLRWADTISLVSKAERTQVALWRQVEMSRSLALHLPPEDGRFLDLGSGNGLPAIPMVIETGVAAELVEADHRKASFLQTAAARLKIPISVTVSRIEALPARSASCVVARALAPLHRLLPMVHRHLAPDGFALLVKGARWADEIEAVGPEWAMDIQHLALGTHSSVLKVAGLRRRVEP